MRCRSVRAAAVPFIRICRICRFVKQKPIASRQGEREGRSRRGWGEDAPTSTMSRFASEPHQREDLTNWHLLVYC